MFADQGRSALRRGTGIARLATIAALLGAAGLTGSAYAGGRGHCGSGSSVSFRISVGSGYSTSCYTRPAYSTCYTRPVYSTCYTRPVVTTCYTRPVVTTCYTRPTYSYSYSYSSVPSYSYSYSYNSGGYGRYDRDDYRRDDYRGGYDYRRDDRGGDHRRSDSGYGDGGARYAQAEQPRTERSQGGYDQWQSQVAQSGGSRIEYGSYNPGAAQPSPAPVAQLARARSGEGEFETGTAVASAERAPRRQSEAAAASTPTREAAKADRSSELIDQGWKALASGKSKQAQEHFGKASDLQASAEARVGLAVSLASLGRNEAAAQAMRRALSSDAEAFAQLRESRQIKPYLGELATNLRGAMSDDGRKAGASPRSAPKARAQDHAVLLAAIEYLNGDSASAAITVAGAGSDDAAQALRTLASGKSGATSVAAR